MSIKDFQSKIRSENGTIFKALRKISNVDNTAKVLGITDEMEGWGVWPEFELRASACA